MGDETRHAEKTHLSWKGTRKHRKNRDDPWYGWIPVGLAVGFLAVVADIVYGLAS
jgi:hypothetical protein